MFLEGLGHLMKTTVRDMATSLEVIGSVCH